MSTEPNKPALTICATPKELSAFLEKGKSAVSLALPKHLNPDRMLRLALTCFSTTPQLRKCSAQSILASIVVASQIGLEPGVTGQGYLIPYKGTCTFVPGWQGLVQLLNNSGRATAWTGAVYEGDHFDYELGSNPHLSHKPGPNFGDPEKLMWVYACGKVNGSEQPVIEAWPIERVWRHRDRFNKVGDAHYSYNHPEMYARKVVLLQVLKYMPRSIELENALTAANAAEVGHTTHVEGGVVIEATSDMVETVKTADAPRSFLNKPDPAAAPDPALEPEQAPVPRRAATHEQSAPEPKDGREEVAVGSESAPSTTARKAPALAVHDELKSFMDFDGVTLDVLFRWCQQRKLVSKTIPWGAVTDITEKLAKDLVNDWGTVLAELKP